MNDRELLEMAAKAAGYPLCSEWNAGKAGILLGKGDGDLKLWNPLTDDGDALRLAVKLGISVFPPAYNGGWEATASAKADDTSWIDETSGSHEESTRRAIVRAAAEIGRSMQ